MWTPKSRHGPPLGTRRFCRCHARPTLATDYGAISRHRRTSATAAGTTPISVRLYPSNLRNLRYDDERHNKGVEETLTTDSKFEVDAPTTRDMADIYTYFSAACVRTPYPYDASLRSAPNTPHPDRIARSIWTAQLTDSGADVLEDCFYPGSMADLSVSLIALLPREQL